MNLAGMILVALLSAASIEQPQSNDERVLSYVSDVTVNRDGSLLVRETITVRALGDQIKHGIYRDFPTNYKTRWLTRFTVTFDVQEVTRDGKPEPYHTKSQSNGVRVYIGDPDNFVPSGEHTYMISYRTQGQLAFRKNEDELYWNVSGNGWVFPIDSMRATVHLPRHLSDRELKLNAFTGAQGSTGQDYTSSVAPDGEVTFNTTRPLDSYEGMTISTVFPKGLVAEPDLGAIIKKWAVDNRALRFALFGTTLTIAYFVFAWFLVGRDPEAGQFRARSVPPQDISPAAARFLTRMGFDKHTFAAALVSLAIKKCIRIVESEKSFKVESLESPTGGCSPEEKMLLSKLLPNGGSIAFKQTNYKRIAAALQACQSSLRNQYEKRYFLNNYSYFLPGVALTLMTIVSTLWMSPHNPDAPVLFLCIWLSMWSLGCLALGVMVITSWRQAFTGVVPFVGALFSTAFATPFFAAEIFVLALIFGSSAAWALPLIVGLAVLNNAFYQWMKAPTKLGRKVLDEIDGFRAYLQGGKNLMLQMTPPDSDQFNEYFAYAMALDVDKDWADRFTAAVTDAQKDTTQYNSYQPYWYRGDLWDRHGMHGFSNSLSSSMTSVISSSSTAPGSSSGSSSSSSGSSGGGGGGGGGGGW